MLDWARTQVSSISYGKKLSEDYLLYTIIYLLSQSLLLRITFLKSFKISLEIIFQIFCLFLIQVGNAVLRTWNFWITSVFDNPVSTKLKALYLCCRHFVFNLRLC